MEQVDVLAGGRAALDAANIRFGLPWRGTRSDLPLCESSRDRAQSDHVELMMFAQRNEHLCHQPEYLNAAYHHRRFTDAAVD